MSGSSPTNEGRRLVAQAMPCASPDADGRGQGIAHPSYPSRQRHERADVADLERPGPPAPGMTMLVLAV